MRILVTNDDGVYSPGINALVEVLQNYAELVVVCPDQERSAVSHSITLREPLEIKETRLFGEKVKTWVVNGTPADCVKLAVEVLVPGKIDLVVSGMNIGPNIGRDLHYSGTISGAVEASLLGIPAVAVSLNVTDTLPTDFSSPKNLLNTIMDVILRNNLPEDLLLNVNIPLVAESECKGIKIATPDFSVNRYRHVEILDSNGKLFYWMKDYHSELTTTIPNSDFAFLEEGYITVTSLDKKMTNLDSKCKVMESIENHEFEDKGEYIR